MGEEQRVRDLAVSCQLTPHSLPPAAAVQTSGRRTCFPRGCRSRRVREAGGQGRVRWMWAQPVCGGKPRLRCRSVSTSRAAAGLAGGGGCCSGGAWLRVPTAQTTAFTAVVSAWVKANVHCPFVIIRRGAVVSGGRPTPYWPGTHLHVGCRAAGRCAFSAKAYSGKEAHTLHVLGLVDCATLPPLPRCSAGERAHEDWQPVPAALQPRALA